MESVMGETRLDTPLEAADVVGYLRRHPQFLKQYPDLALALEMPRAEGDVASLASYQVESLRRKNRELERRLADLIRVAGDNENLMVRVHGFVLGLLRAADAQGVMRAVVAGLTEDFHTDLVRLLLFRRDAAGAVHADWLVHLPTGPSALPELADFLAGDEPLVGRLAPERLEEVFGDEAARVHSVALVKLGTLGLLAIGSHDADRFQPGLGGVFLTLIGAAVTTALERHFGD